MKKASAPKAGSGKFAKLAGKVEKSYEKKGVPASKAKKIGSAVAAKVGVAKYGQKAMTKASVAGRKLASKKK